MNEKADARAAEQDAAVAQWQRVALGFKAQLETAEQGAAAMNASCDAAEARAAMAEHRASSLERASAQAASKAALAKNASTKLHDMVVSAFGIGSHAHLVLEVVAMRVAAEWSPGTAAVMVVLFESKPGNFTGPLFEP